MKQRILNAIGAFFTILGVYLFITGDWTNAFLSMILGELINVPKKL
jgi:hypothetical protein